MSRLFEEHLAAEAQDQTRQPDFDMNDMPEMAFEGCPPRLHAALEWLNVHITSEWRAADRLALRSQLYHRRLARVAIFAGTSSIVLAIIQLATKLTFPKLTVTALTLEAVTVVLAVGTVLIGLRAKFDHNWLGHRHHAERLRMLKFRALEKLWSWDDSTWQAWTLEQLETLRHSTDFPLVVQWSSEGDVEAQAPEAPYRDQDALFVSALGAFYVHKRVQFQESYFRNRRDEYRRRAHTWQHITLPFFLTSIIAVLLHFVIEALAGVAALSKWSETLEAFAVWFVALAAIIPVVGAGIRAWFAAFELPRSISLYGAKQFALKRAGAHLDQDRRNVAAIQGHISQIEHFLEEEHREWLRLLRDTEWFM